MDGSIALKKYLISSLICWEAREGNGMMVLDHCGVCICNAVDQWKVRTVGFGKFER